MSLAIASFALAIVQTVLAVLLWVYDSPQVNLFQRAALTAKPFQRLLLCISFLDNTIQRVFENGST